MRPRLKENRYGLVYSQLLNRQLLTRRGRVAPNDPTATVFSPNQPQLTLEHLGSIAFAEGESGTFEKLLHGWIVGQHRSPQ